MKFTQPTKVLCWLINKLNVKKMNTKNLPFVNFEALEHYEEGLTSQNIQKNKNLEIPIGVARMVLQSGCTTPLDSHNVKEAWLIANGEGILTFEGKTTKNVVAGDIVTFDANETHQLKNISDVDMLIYSLWWD